EHRAEMRRIAEERFARTREKIRRADSKALPDPVAEETSPPFTFNSYFGTSRDAEPEPAPASRSARKRDARPAEAVASEPVARPARQPQIRIARTPAPAPEPEPDLTDPESFFERELAPEPPVEAPPPFEVEPDPIFEPIAEV